MSAKAFSFCGGSGDVVALIGYELLNEADVNKLLLYNSIIPWATLRNASFTPEIIIIIVIVAFIATNRYFLQLMFR